MRFLSHNVICVTMLHIVQNKIISDGNAHKNKYTALGTDFCGFYLQKGVQSTFLFLTTAEKPIFL